jgi:putative ABC transport system permease protein
VNDLSCTAHACCLFVFKCGKEAIISDIIAIPFGCWTADKWLQHIAYRNPLSRVTFLLPTVIIIFIAMITMSFQSIKAALAIPVKSWRIES